MVVVVLVINRGVVKGAAQTTPSHGIVAQFVLALGENSSELIIYFVVIIAFKILHPLGLDLFWSFDSRNFLKIDAFSILQQVEGANLIFISDGLFDLFTITISGLVVLGRRLSAKIGKLGTNYLLAQIQLVA